MSEAGSFAGTPSREQLQQVLEVDEVERLREIRTWAVHSPCGEQRQEILEVDDEVAVKIRGAAWRRRAIGCCAVDVVALVGAAAGRAIRRETVSARAIVVAAGSWLLAGSCRTVDVVALVRTATSRAVCGEAEGARTVVIAARAGLLARRRGAI